MDQLSKINPSVWLLAMRIFALLIWERGRQ
jgi:hypothetical protein